MKNIKQVFLSVLIRKEDPNYIFFLLQFHLQVTALKKKEKILVLQRSDGLAEVLNINDSGCVCTTSFKNNECFIVTTAKTMATGRVGRNIGKSVIIRHWSLK